MPEMLLLEAEEKMEKAIVALHSALAKIRTGRAHPSLLDSLTVSYYGADTPLSQVASVSVADARTLLVIPWEKDMVAPIEKAIMTSGLGLNPATSGTNIRIPLPPLTEQRRLEMIKLVKADAENAKISVRNVRRDVNTKLKNMEKASEITEDDVRKFEHQVQQMTDSTVKKIDQMVADKEKDLLTV